jgi:transposase InsO family protein
VVQDIGNTWDAESEKDSGMPWQPLDLMNTRTEFALRALETDNFRALCREYGISARVGYKWRERFLAHGLEGLREGSRRPHSSPEALSEEVLCRMVRLKERHRHWGPRKIREVYLRQWGQAPSESSFKRVLDRCGLTIKRAQRRVRAQARLSTGRRAAACNEIWTVDFKGWWHDPQGRCEPLTVRDEFSRYVLEIRALANARTATVRECFERLFERHGLPAAIRTDNGPPFASTRALLGLSKLSAWWLANGIDLERGRPGCPQDNGGHERLHRDIARELQGVGQVERQASFETWRQEFNQERPHEALAMRPPGELYRSSERRWQGSVEAISYEGMIARRVQKSGTIRFEAESFFLSQALAGWDVGLAAQADGSLEVFFARVLLGRLEPQSAAFIPVTAALEQASAAADPLAA